MFFDSCKTLDDLKKLYKSLVFEHHPDRGGDLETMKAVNIEYEAAFKRLKAAHNEEAARPESAKRATMETPEEFRVIVERLIRLDGIEIELCGSWLWIGGDTRKHKEALKAAGCRWSRLKGLWYWHHAEDGAHLIRGKSSMDEIRSKYGSEILGASKKRVALQN